MKRILTIAFGICLFTLAGVFFAAKELVGWIVFGVCACIAEGVGGASEG